MRTRSAILMLALSVGFAAAGAARADDTATLVRELPVKSNRPQARPIHDVALQPGGVLRGRFVDGGGTPIDGAEIVIRQKDRVATVQITDARGEFTAEGLSSGVYRIESPTASSDYRLWQSSAAPPAARPVALVVSQDPTLRGQYPYRNIDLLTLGLGAGGVTLGVLALDKADDAEARANRMEAELEGLTPVSP